ncbi:MAG: flagellar biosynthetic protein FliR, partial [Rubrivivax sp.]|nr:flagellar biosynthetic protein FliR [Rubrivivax sp.]
MLTFTEAQVLQWISPLVWPFLRALALFTALPVLGTRTVPVRVRIALAACLALAAQPSL